MKKRIGSRNGFTLVELFIAIAVILIIAGVFLGKASEVLGMTKSIRAKAELATIRDSIFLAESKAGKTLIQITDNSCQQCACYNDPTTDPESVICIQGWLNNRAAIIDALGQGYSLPERDPWGSPYEIQENEGRYGPGGWNFDGCDPSPETLCDNNRDGHDDRDRDRIDGVDIKDFCVPDLVISAGADRKRTTGDDIKISITFASSICSTANFR